MLCLLSASHVVVPGWEDEELLIVGYTEDPPRKRRKVADEGVCLCHCFPNMGYTVAGHSTWADIRELY